MVMVHQSSYSNKLIKNVTQKCPSVAALIKKKSDNQLWQVNWLASFQLESPVRYIFEHATVFNNSVIIKYVNTLLLKEPWSFSWLISPEGTRRTSLREVPRGNSPSLISPNGKLPLVKLPRGEFPLGITLKTENSSIFVNAFFIHHSLKLKCELKKIGFACFLKSSLLYCALWICSNCKSVQS